MFNEVKNNVININDFKNTCFGNQIYLLYGIDWNYFYNFENAMLNGTLFTDIIII